MSRRGRKKSLQKRINPTYYVFCEGDTEEEYVKFLKRHYRIPIEIKSKIQGNSISERKVRAYLKDRPYTQKDRTFLLYDIDAPNMLERLQAIRNTELLVSNPCIELWFLLHYKNQTAVINTANCIKKIEEIWAEYKKGVITEKCKNEMLEKQAQAIERANLLNRFNNPCTTIPDLIQLLEEAKANKI